MKKLLLGRFHTEYVHKESFNTTVYVYKTSAIKTLMLKSKAAKSCLFQGSVYISASSIAAVELVWEVILRRIPFKVTRQCSSTSQGLIIYIFCA